MKRPSIAGGVEDWPQASRNRPVYAVPSSNMRNSIYEIVCTIMRASINTFLQPASVVGLPADEAFDRFVFGEAKAVVGLRGRAVAVFGALPELAQVGAGEESLVLLRLVLEDRGPL